MRWILGAGLVCLLGCAPAHMKTLSLTHGGRDLPGLILGGWDGHRLNLFDDTSIEPGVSKFRDLDRALGHLSSDQYAAVYVEAAKLDAAAAAHGIFCHTVACVAVLERMGGDEFSQWGQAQALFELRGIDEEPLGSVWLQDRAIRPPGPRKWPLLCRSKTDQPRNVHADGAAIFPALVQGSSAFALFGPPELPAEYQKVGFAAPSETLCDEEAVRIQKEPAPERPVIKPDPALMQKLK
jgi:hypothetical protein